MMHFESFYPFLLLLAPFAIAFFLEAVVLYFFRLKRFWPAVGTSLFINLLALAVLYGSTLLLGKLGYSFDGLQFPLQVVFFLWWLSLITDGVLLRLFTKNATAKTIYSCSLVMNTLSWIFLYFFLSSTH